MARLLAGPSVRVTTRRVVGAPCEAVLRPAPMRRLVVVRSRDALHLLRFMDRVSSRSVAGPADRVPSPRLVARLRDLRPVLLAISDPADSAAAPQTWPGDREGTAHPLRLLYTWHLPGRADDLRRAAGRPRAGRLLPYRPRASLEHCRTRYELRGRAGRPRGPARHRRRPGDAGCPRCPGPGARPERCLLATVRSTSAGPPVRRCTRARARRCCSPRPPRPRAPLPVRATDLFAPPPSPSPVLVEAGAHGRLLVAGAGRIAHPVRAVCSPTRG